jgi:ferredoxin
MRVVVNLDLCEANALCVQNAPEVFELDDEDVLHVIQPEPDEALRQRVEAAAAACPKIAITIEE